MQQTPPVFASFDSLVRFFSDADEIVFQLYIEVGDEQIAALCREARETAHHLHGRFGPRPAAELAAVYGVEVAEARWNTAEGRVVYLGECRLQPPRITLNLDAIEALSEFAERRASEAWRCWFTSAHIRDVVTAHELYHIIKQGRQRSSSRPVELAAHAFARTLTGLPFSGLLYEALLRQMPAAIGSAIEGRDLITQ
jgi:hypothetical protein